jgi:hypothetical protein
MLVPPKNANRLAESIIHMLEHPDLAANMGAALKSALFPQYSLSSMVEKTQRLYLDLYENRGERG